VNDCVAVDASLAVKWVLQEPYTDEALALAGEWAVAGVNPVAPCLLFVEATNVLHRRVMLGHISLSEARRLLNGLLSLGIQIRESPEIHVRAMELAHELGESAVYDTHYLALAEILECELWTADERFFNSVREHRPRVRWLGEYSGG